MGRRLVISLVVATAALAALAPSAHAGYKDTFELPCMGGFVSFQSIVDIPMAAPDYAVVWMTMSGDPILDPSHLCPGQSGGPSDVRSPNTKTKDNVTITIPATAPSGTDTTVTVAALSENDLSLKKSVKGGSGEHDNDFKSGQTVHFVLTLENFGSLQAKGLKVTDHIPKHCKFLRAKVDPDTGATLKTPDKGDDGGDVTVTLDKPLKPGQKRVIHIFCRASVKDEQEFLNHSELKTDPSQIEPDPDPHPNQLDAGYLIKPRH